jgi:hypothetical protein
MAYISIPKDLEKIKSKVVGIFSTRQLVSLVFAACVCIPLYFILQEAPQPVALTVSIFSGLPFLFLGMYERNGMPVEEWLKGWLDFSLLSGTVRVYKRPSLSPEAILQRKRKISAAQAKPALKDARGLFLARLIPSSSGSFIVKLAGIAIIPSIIIEFLTQKMRQSRGIETEVKTSQESLAFIDIRADGLVILPSGMYSRTIRFDDINYQLGHHEEKNKIFADYMQFLNSFDSSVHCQLTFVNQTGSSARNSIPIPLMNDGMDSLRADL